MLAVWRLDRLHLQPEVHALQKEFFFIGLASIVIVMAAGYGRTFTYISNVYGEDAEKERRRLLIIKHVILGVVFGLGTWWQYAMVYR